MTANASVRQAAREAVDELKRMSRDSGGFDASRYFRSDETVTFFNVGTPRMRALARSIHARHQEDWTLADALGFADLLLRLPQLESKAVGVEVLAPRREEFSARQLAVWKRWLADGYSSNWATTDAICGYLVGPLLARHRDLISQMRGWSRHRGLWVRRASAVSLVGLARRGVALDEAYDIARTLHPDPADLIHKAVGWLLREAGKTDMPRLERYLRANGASIPRTTVRYALERFSQAKRAALLAATRA